MVSLEKQIFEDLRRKMANKQLTIQNFFVQNYHHETGQSTGYPTSQVLSHEYEIEKLDFKAFVDFFFDSRLDMHNVIVEVLYGGRLLHAMRPEKDWTLEGITTQDIQSDDIKMYYARMPVTSLFSIENIPVGNSVLKFTLHVINKENHELIDTRDWVVDVQKVSDVHRKELTKPNIKLPGQIMYTVLDNQDNQYFMPDAHVTINQPLTMTDYYETVIKFGFLVVPEEKYEVVFEANKHVIGSLPLQVAEQSVLTNNQVTGFVQHGNSLRLPYYLTEVHLSLPLGALIPFNGLTAWHTLKIQLLHHHQNIAERIIYMNGQE